jgi:predicted RNA-binding protein
MCEARVYLGDDSGEKEEQIMEDVILVQPEGDAYLLVSLLGEQKLVQGRIKRIDFLRHTVHLSQLPEASAES